MQHLSTDNLTHDILKAIIRRTHVLVHQLNPDVSTVEYFEGTYFTWNHQDGEPTLTIDYKQGTEPYIVYLWWNGKFDESEIEVQSNIPFSATENLAYYVGLESRVYKELAELAELIPPQPFDISDEEEEQEHEE